MESARSDDDGVLVLICDDSDMERKALGQVLRQRGYHVDEAADGAAALRMIKGRPYDLLLLDLQMPQVDGFDVLKFLQKERPQLPVVVLSGLPADQIGDGMHRLPSQELPPLLLKPVDSQQLFDVIELKLAGELP